MSRRIRTGRAGHERRSAQPIETNLPSTGLSVLIMLLTCMFLWPSEAAMQGDGLHLSFLWLTAASITCFWQLYVSRARKAADSSAAEQPSRQPGFSARSLVNAGLFLLIAGIWLSTWHVFWVSGDRRVALNLAFEWTAIGACGFLCRQTFESAEHRRMIITLIACLGVGMAVFGVWKSQIVYAAEAQSYREKRQILDSDGSSLEAMQVRHEFLTNDIPMEGSAKELFENRLLNSTEPFGTFALANTFAGVLAVSVVLLFARVHAGWQSGSHSRWNLILPMLLLAIVGWCLISTKSRTAWVGTGMGILVILMSHVGDEAPRSKQSRFIRWLLLITVLAVAVLLVCLLTGAIDRQVFLEAPRSFQFRLFYWIGAVGVIAEHWLFGAGPGNFRQLYLRHKVVESSESIVDPHNIVLDAWCFAGIVGLVGLLIFVAGIAGSCTQADVQTKEKGASSLSVVPGLVGCLAVHFGWHWISGGTLSMEDGILALAIGLSAVSMMVIRRLPWNSCAPAAATITLLIHLLGAGGLHITIVGILLVVLGCAATTTCSTEAPWKPHSGRFFMFAGGLSAAGIAAAVLFLAVIPVRTSGIHQSLGQQKLYSNDRIGALAAFQRAAIADPLTPVARQHIATATAYELLNPVPDQGNGGAAISAQEIEAVETVCDDWIQADRRQLKSRLTRGQIRYQLFLRTGQKKYSESCLADMRQAVSWHPTNAGLQIDLAILEDEFGFHDHAAQAATEALRIEAVNRSWNHTDQYLTETDLQIAQQIIDGVEE